MWQAISQQLSDTLMFEYQITEKVKLSGGDISESYMINDGEQRYFVKLNDRDFLAKFEVEAESLHLLRETSTLFVPEVVLVGKTKTHSFIILNYLPTKPLEDASNSFKFGQQLARLHLWGEQKSSVSTAIIISGRHSSQINGTRNGASSSQSSVSGGNCNC